MSKRSLDLSGKIETGLLGVLRDASGVTASLGIHFFVIGATARDIVLDYGFGIQPSRATRDLDLGVQVADWEKFQALAKGLVSSGAFISSSATQRFFHQKSGFPVDIVPFGKIAASKDAISWPPEHEVEMNILGFAKPMGMPGLCGWATIWKYLSPPRLAGLFSRSSPGMTGIALQA